MVKGLQVAGDVVAFTVVVRDPSAPFATEVKEAAARAVRERLGERVTVHVDVDNELMGLGEMQVSGSGKTTPSAQPQGVRNFVAVASGKGGVGKSTVAANLAVALARQGYAVGLVDTDIYGPSIPTMFGVKDEKPRVNEARKIIPLERSGVKLLSMGFLASCNNDGDSSGESAASTGLSADASAIAEARGLTPDDIAAALKTYTPEAWERVGLKAGSL